MASGHTSSGAGPQLLSFSKNLQQHLTELSLRMNPKEVRVRHLRALTTLTALQKLQLHASYYQDLERETLALKLPNLVSLHMYAFKQGEIFISCPKLAEAVFKGTKSLDIDLEDAALDNLVLVGCKMVIFNLYSSENQLENLRSLCVIGCSELGTHLIERVSHMRHLRSLVYRDFPATCMPRSFPHGLQTSELAPSEALIW